MEPRLWNWLNQFPHEGDRLATTVFKAVGNGTHGAKRLALPLLHKQQERPAIAWGLKIPTPDLAGRGDPQRLGIAR